jgi:hypothetical protein
VAAREEERLIRIETMPTNTSRYPCYEVHPGGVAVFAAYRARPRYLTHDQFAKEFPMAKKPQPAPDPSMRSQSEPAPAGTPASMELGCGSCGAVEEFPGDIMANQPCTTVGCKGRMVRVSDLPSLGPKAEAESFVLASETDERAGWAEKIAAKLPFLRPGRCRSCGAAILWGKTPTGADMPLDPSARPLQVLVINEETKVVESCKALASHWSSCPNAASHKTSAKS